MATDWSIFPCVIHGLVSNHVSWEVQAPTASPATTTATPSGLHARPTSLPTNSSPSTASIGTARAKARKR